MRAATMLELAALLGGTGVALGAFAAHGLGEILPAQRLSAFETGARYQMIHALALVGASALRARVATASPAARWLDRAAVFWLAGVVLFSGSLYALSLTGLGWLGAITPVGGVALLAAWALLFVAAHNLRDKP